MVFGERRRRLPCDGVDGLSGRTLGQFQRWAVRRLYTVVPFRDYDAAMRLPPAGAHNAPAVRAR